MDFREIRELGFVVDAGKPTARVESPTAALRYRNGKLQQAWKIVCDDAHEYEWRDVPEVVK